MKRKLTLLAFALTGAIATAHEGHETPGALPPAPNGGRMAEAAHAATDHHEGKPEAELFIEAKLEGTKLKLFPHALGPTDMNAFKALKPGTGLTLTELKMELRISELAKKIARKAGCGWALEKFSRKRRNTFSTSTIASSTSSPTAIANPPQGHCVDLNT